MPTQIEKLQSQITWLKNKYACLLTSGCGCSGEGGTTTDQDNVFKMVTTDRVDLTQPTYASQETLIVTAINNGAQFVSDETNNIMLKVPVTVVASNVAAIYHRYYKLLNKGKGTYGLASGNTITTSDIQLERSTEPLVLNTTSLLPVKVFDVFSSLYATPDTAINAGATIYTIDTSVRDYYFWMYDATRGLETPYVIYRWVGGSGNYGNTGGGGTAALPSDFIVVDTKILEQNNDKITEKVTNINSVIGGEGVSNDNIAKAVIRSLKGSIYVPPFTIQKFGVIRRTTRTRTDTTVDVTLTYEKYHWKNGDTIVDGTATVSDFDIEYATPVTAELPTGRTNPPQVIPVLNPDINAPEDALNNNATPVVTDDTNYKTYFVVFNPSGAENDFTIFEFTGADSTYGDGQIGTAVGGDFSPVTVKDVTENIAITKTSQLINDGQNGTSRYVEEPDIPSSDITPFLRETTISLTAGQIKTLASAPVVAIAAPGVGLGIEVISCSTSLTWGSVAFDANDFEIACSTAVSGDAQFRHDTNFISATADVFARMQLKIDSAAVQVIENDDVVLRMPADSVATGDSTVKAYIIYRIIDLT